MACYLPGPVAAFMHPGRRRGAGLVATGKSGADAGSVFAPGRPAAVSAGCAAAQACGCRCHPPHLGPAAHRGGRQAGTRQLERLTPRDNRSSGTQTVPAAALFVIGAGPRTR